MVNIYITATSQLTMFIGKLDQEDSLLNFGITFCKIKFNNQSGDLNVDHLNTGNI